jgi:hypothetical protein
MEKIALLAAERFLLIKPRGSRATTLTPTLCAADFWTPYFAEEIGAAVSNGALGPGSRQLVCYGEITGDATRTKSLPKFSPRNRYANHPELFGPQVNPAHRSLHRAGADATAARSTSPPVAQLISETVLGLKFVMINKT